MSDLRSSFLPTQEEAAALISHFARSPEIDKSLTDWKVLAEGYAKLHSLANPQRPVP